VWSLAQFVFTGRMPLAETVQMSGTTRESAWMGCHRSKTSSSRGMGCNAWRQTGLSTSTLQTRGQSPEKFVLSGADSLWLELNLRLAREGCSTITKELSIVLYHRFAVCVRVHFRPCLLATHIKVTLSSVNGNIQYMAFR
jgi:hypothetical protein